MGLAAVVAVDLLIDGFLLGVAAAQDLRLGLLLAIGLTLEDFFVALSLVLSLRESAQRRTILAVSASITLAMSVGIVVGALIGPTLSTFGYHIVLAFGAVALLFLVLEELMREAHKARETLWSITALFGGLLGFLLLHMTV